MSVTRTLRTSFQLLALAAVMSASLLPAQQVPAAGYMFPPGGQAGTTIDVTLSGYDWTPDMDVHSRHPEISLVLAGPLGPVIVPEPPYWFEKKARRPPFPLPREIAAKLTLPPGLAPGVYRWQAANANGATESGRFVVSNGLEVVEVRGRKEPQPLPSLPVHVSGQILKIEEVDRYQFTPSTTGLVTLRTQAAVIGSPLNAVVEVRDANGRLLADAADTEGRDTVLTFKAEAGQTCVASVYDVDFRGDRSFVYRLLLDQELRVTATRPVSLLPGETRDVEFIGYGLQTGAAQLESVTRAVTVPAEAAQDTFEYALQTDHGAAVVPITLRTSSGPQPLSVPDVLEPDASANGPTPLGMPVTVTGRLDRQYGADRYRIEGTRGQVLAISVRARQIGAGMDLFLAVLDAEGKELKRIDDVPGTTDASLEFTLPADGAFDLLVGDTSGRSGQLDSVYQLSVAEAQSGFELTLPELLGVQVGSKAALAIKAVRTGGYTGPIRFTVSGLPTGITVPDDIVMPEKSNDVRIEFSAAETAPTASVLVAISARAEIPLAGPATEPAANAATATEPAPVRVIERTLEPVLLAVTLKPPFSIDAEGKDDVTKWPRGSTFPGPVLISRNEGFNGEIVLEMSAKQGRHRQGIRGPELTVAPGVERVLYPVFLPEWLETTRTSRMVVNGVAKVPDPAGRERYLSTKLVTRIGFLPTGALLKIDCPLPELEVPAGAAFDFPVSLFRAVELTEPARIELVVDEDVAESLQAEALTLDHTRTEAVLRIIPNPQNPPRGEHRVKVRATVLQDGDRPVVSETTLLVVFGTALEVSGR